MDNIISIILKDQNKILEQINTLEEKIKKIKNKIKKLEIIITFLFITNLTTIFLLWR